MSIPESIAAWLGAHETWSLVVVALAAYGAFALALLYGPEVKARLRNEPMFGEESFLPPSLVWMLLTAADQGLLRRALVTVEDDEVGPFTRSDWFIGEAQVPGAFALTDQPSELVFLGLLAGEEGLLSVTDRGREALHLYENQLEREFDALLRSSHREARQRRKVSA